MHRYNHHIWQKNLDALEKLVLLYLLDRANQEGVCWPSITTIAASTGLARRTVLKVLGELERKGYLARERTGMTNTYRLNLTKIALVSGPEGDGAPDAPGSAPDAPTSAPHAPYGAPDAPGSARGAPDSAPGALGSASHAPGSAPGALGVVHEVHQVVHVVHPNQTNNQTVEPNIELPPPPIVPPQNSDRRQEEEEVEEAKAKKAEEKKASPSPEKPNPGNLKGFLAAALGGVSRTAIAHTPEVPGEMVRLLKERDLWTELARLRRYARDERAWFSWLAGPIARLWQSNPEGFPEALAEALAALARRPEVREPLTYVEAVARKRLTPNGEATRSEEDPAARALRLLREGQEPSDEDLAELFRQHGVPTKAGVGRYNGMSADGEWVYARLGGDIIAVSRREAIRRLVDGEHEEVAHAG